MKKFKEIKIRVIKEYIYEKADQFAIRFFVDEIRDKTECELKCYPGSETIGAAIVFCRSERFFELPDKAKKSLERLKKTGKEGFRLCFVEDSIYIEAADSRGLLYGACKLLRNMFLDTDRLGVIDDFTDISSSPRYLMRGHQLAYRDKNNTYSAWSFNDFERYIRDLMVFGTNCIEILPPRTDDRLYSAHFTEDPWKMLINLSELIHSLGLDVSIWYPYLSKATEGPEFEKEMEERREVFQAAQYIDEMLIPAGDPGELRPKEMFRAAEESVRILHESHPNAKVWVAPQIFEPDETWYQEFYSELEKEPEWLYGVCFGPWVKDTIDELHAKLPNKYKNRIRHYPDISHNMNSQFEIPDWDAAFPGTEGRESYNARPYEMKTIHSRHKDYVMGSITYSEGIHDDFNKMIWSELDFDPNISAEDAVHEYVRYFMSPEYEDEISELLLHLETNWRGSILENKNIDTLYSRALDLDSRLDFKTKNNYRYQMLLLRIIADHQIRDRRKRDLEYEKEAYSVLKQVDRIGADQAMKDASACLFKTYTDPKGEDDRIRMQQLADALFKNCKIQLTSFRHKGQATDRGAWLDTLFLPVNDASYLLRKFAEIRKKGDEAERLKLMKEMAYQYEEDEKTRYYNIGDFKDYEKVVKNISWESDPGTLRSPVLHHNSSLISMLNKTRGWYDEPIISQRWLHGARTLYGTPLEIILKDLNPRKRYTIKISYQQILLYDHIDMNFWAGDELVHKEINKHGDEWNPCFEYELPPSSYQNGSVHLKWQTYKVEVPCVVSEIWIKEKGINRYGNENSSYRSTGGR